MTVREQQDLAAAGGQTRPEPVATGKTRAVERPVATVAAAVHATAQRRPVARPAAAVQDRPEAATAPFPVQHAQQAGQALPVSPPGERPPRREPLDLPVLRIVCWQLALVLVFLAVGRPWPVVTVLVPAAVALLACTAVRVRGQWLSDELAQRVLLVLRRRERDLPGADGARMLLRILARGASARTAVLAGTPSGVVSRAEELVAVLRPADVGAAALAEFALSGVALADTTGATEPGQPALRFQLVVHRGPQQTDQARAWLVVRALREPGFADDAELLVAVSNAVRKLHRRIRGTGIAVGTLTALTEREVLATLAALTHTGPGRGAIREDRRYWRAGPIAQAGIRLSGLGPRSPMARVHLLHRVLAAVPGTACTVSVTVPEYAAVVRVAATTDAAVDVATGWLLRTPPPGIRLERMDNQHAAAVAASLPIGGNP
ncbi:hypothetical protein ABZ863_09395 [Saccharomonospora sp. NPDC046836]|uniref:hypothetical protein n=1 Tax=Saccharomonospora sp. NPDC046836 TaxID=3156921 RepID=UPI0033DF8D14